MRTFIKPIYVYNKDVIKLKTASTCRFEVVSIKHVGNAQESTFLEAGLETRRKARIEKATQKKEQLKLTIVDFLPNVFLSEVTFLII